jgi:hypothetical protein
LLARLARPLIFDNSLRHACKQRGTHGNPRRDGFPVHPTFTERVITMASSIKTVRRQISLDKLVSSDTLNVRLASNYDLDVMHEQIRAKGGVMKPLLVEPIPDQKGHYQILQGNRRFRSAVYLYAHPDTTPELRDALAKLECDIVDQPITEKDRLGLILDHGESKGLTRLETVLAVWKMDAQMYSTAAIGEMMYYQLAQYTGNTGNLAKIAALKNEPAKRRDAIKKWFHGTLDQKILLANRLGSYVRDQFILNTQAEDGPLPEGTTVEMVLTQTHLSELRKAREADLDAGGWTPEQGGEAFNAKIQQFKDETAGRRDKSRTERPTAAKLKEQAQQIYKSAPIRAALLTAAGENSAGAGLVEMDKAIYRWSLVTEILTSAANRPNLSPALKGFITALIGDGPAADVEIALSALLTADPAGKQS